MSRIRFKKQIISYFCITVLAITSTTLLITNLSTPAEAGPDFFGRIQRFFVGSRPQGVASGRPRGGARRDRCPNVSDPLIAIVPFDKDNNLFVEKTISDRPTFWFYVPYLPTARRKAEFVIVDENEEDVYAATFPLSQQSGIVSLQLPETAPALKEGKKYQWVFSVICNPLNRSGDATVNGWIEKVPSSESLSAKLKTASPEQLVAIYADEGLWNESITSLASFGKANTQNENFRSSWAALQKQIGLTEISSSDWVTYALPDPNQPSRNTSQSQPLPSLIPLEAILDGLKDEPTVESSKPPRKGK